MFYNTKLSSLRSDSQRRTQVFESCAVRTPSQGSVCKICRVSSVRSLQTNHQQVCEEEERSVKATAL
jgi:hypothetical protein